jgi:hypothetical protein
MPSEKTVSAVFEVSHAPLLTPRHHLQIDDLREVQDLNCMQGSRERQI